MILRQTAAIFLDAYREINSKRLFWLGLAISLAVVVGISLPTNDEKGISVLGLHLDFPFMSTKAVSRVGFYKFLFSYVGVGFWLTWGATILALISTASMIPDMVTGGSIELSLSRPIGRLRLFLTKYAAGLLFVAAQVAIFSLGAFIVILIRGGKLEPGVFLAIPLVVMIYSFLFCICALVGLLTRSGMTAMLATMLFWLLLFALNTTEHVLLEQKLSNQAEAARESDRVRQMDERIEDTRRQLASLVSVPAPSTPKQEPEPAPVPPTTDTAPPTSATEPPAPSSPSRGRGRSGSRQLTDLFDKIKANAAPTTDRTVLDRRLTEYTTARERFAADAAKSEESLGSIAPWHRGFYAAKTILPKTSETASLVDRWVIDKSDIDGVLKMMDDGIQQSSSRALKEALAARSIGWVLGTSLAFEAFILGIAGWIFARRDF